MTSNALRKELLRLSVAERLELVEEVWDSIAAEAASLPVPESHRRELARRRQEHRDHPEDVIPWEEVRTQLSVCGDHRSPSLNPRGSRSR